MDAPRIPLLEGGRTGVRVFPTSITGNIPPLHPDLARAIGLLGGFHPEHAHSATHGVGEEDRGAMIISDILLHQNLPRPLARWTPTGAPGEIQVPLANEYIQEGDTRVFLNGVRPHDRVVIVDDLINTGGTLVALIDAVHLAGASVLEVLTVGEKAENGRRTFVREKTGFDLKTMLVTSLKHRGDRCYSKLMHLNLG